MCVHVFLVPEMCKFENESVRMCVCKQAMPLFCFVFRPGPGSQSTMHLLFDQGRWGRGGCNNSEGEYHFCLSP